MVNANNAGYTGTVHFTSSDPQAVLPADYTFTSADQGVHTFTATLKTAGTQSLTATDKATAGVFGTQAGIMVNPAAAANFLVAGFPTAPLAGVAGTLTVTARDAYGNTATGYTGTVTFASSDLQSSLPAAYTFTAADRGIHTFNATLKTAGTQSIIASDNAAGISATQGNIQVNPGAFAQFIVSGYPSGVAVGTSNEFTVTAVDAYGNTVTGYTGTVHFSSDDPNAVLPADAVFMASDHGTRTFSASFGTTGIHYLKVTDTATGKSGEQDGIQVV
jgi:hypothetical protein